MLAGGHLAALALLLAWARGADPNDPAVLHALLHARLEAVLPRVRARRAGLPRRLAPLAPAPARATRPAIAPASTAGIASRGGARGPPDCCSSTAWKPPSGGITRGGPRAMEGGRRRRGGAVLRRGRRRLLARPPSAAGAGTGAPTYLRSRGRCSSRRAGALRQHGRGLLPRVLEPVVLVEALLVGDAERVADRRPRGGRDPLGVLVHADRLLLHASRPRAGRTPRRHRAARAPTRGRRWPRRGRSRSTVPRRSPPGPSTSRPDHAPKSSKSRCVGRSVTFSCLPGLRPRQTPSRPESGSRILRRPAATDGQ